MTEAGRIMILF